MLPYPVASDSLTTTTGATGHRHSFVRAIQCAPQCVTVLNAALNACLLPPNLGQAVKEILHQAQAVAINVDNLVAILFYLVLLLLGGQHTPSEETAPLLDVKLDLA